MNATAVRPVKFILEDEVEGMMNEDRNVLINAEENKKKFWMPEDCWGIVKEFMFLPANLIKYFDIVSKRAYCYNTEYSWMYNVSVYPELHKYTIKIEKEGKVDYSSDGYYGIFLYVAKSRAKKAKEDLVRFLNYRTALSNKTYEEEKNTLLYSKKEFYVSHRNFFIKNPDELEDKLKSVRRIEREYNLYLNFMDEIKPLLNIV